MKDLTKNVKKDPVPIYTCKKRPGPNLTNGRNYAYSACCDNCVANLGSELVLQC